MKKRILVTGAAGFIGMHTTEFLLNRGDAVVGLDNLNAYYDPSLKKARLAKLHAHPQTQNFTFTRADLADAEAIAQVFKENRFDGVINLAAQAGVRHSLNNPQAYVDSNLTGFINILEGVRHQCEKISFAASGARSAAAPCHLVYASSSSVYGGNKKLPFAETDRVDHPVSLYAATKKANELMAHTYSHLFRIPATGLRFFTVYGPWGRPDMAVFIFTKAILAGEPITLFNHGNMQRDFTYIDDIVQGVVRALDKPPVAEPSTGDFAFDMTAPHRVLNIGNHNPEPLGDLVAIIEDAVGIKAKQNPKPLQPGDVPTTYAEISSLRALTGFAPSTPLREGIARFISWYRGFYQV
jgi:UDP-glucuronate 4-epimerase